MLLYIMALHVKTESSCYHFAY